MAKVLIIDDDEDMSYTLSRMVQQMGCRPTTALTLHGGLEKAKKENPDVVFLDVHLPDGNGLSLIPALKGLPDAPEVIIITAFGDTDGAETALKSGVWDYIQKPSQIHEMKLPLSRALQFREQRRKQTAPVAVKRAGIVGSSPRMSACIDQMARAAASDASLLLTGETGTGKELFANAIHINSARASR
ncbi:MAG: sigma-54-dependent Fis family transcriptional regulator, partial [Desulfobacterales bacterium]|nr:sigma-54-dependent Fis family transcriptional regulator [Desulfobacterales bacterium]